MKSVYRSLFTLACFVPAVIWVPAFAADNGNVVTVNRSRTDVVSFARPDGDRGHSAGQRRHVDLSLPCERAHDGRHDGDVSRSSLG